MFIKKNTLAGHNGALYALGANTSNNLLYTAGSDKNIVSWDISQPDVGKVIARTPAIIYSLCYIAVTNHILAATSHGMVHIIDCTTNKEIRALRFFNAPIFNVIYFVDQNIVAILSGHGVVSFCHTHSYEIIKTVECSESKLRQVCYVSSQNQFVVANGDGSFTCIDASDYRVAKTVIAHKQGWSVNTLYYNKQTDTLYTASRDAMIYGWNATKNYEKIFSVPAHNYAIYKMEANPSGLLVATCSRDKSIKIWDTNLQFLLRLGAGESAGHTHSVNNIVWMSDNMLVSCSDDSTIIVWEKKYI